MDERIYLDESQRDDDWAESTPMRDFYKDKKIFLSGATGGVGQLIVQKLLRIDVDEICILVRSKKGKTAFERMQTLFQNTVFAKARQKNPKFMDKIRIIEGDINEKKLGISERDIDYIIKNVHIVLHVAADVRFDQPFKNAILTNVRSVVDLIEISEKIKNLKGFIYMSTAFSNVVPHIEEKSYQLPIDPKVLIKFAESLEDDDMHLINILTLRMISPWSNTYTYTKNIAEYVVQMHSKRFPTAIIRPSIIIATYKEPVPGWCDNIYGLNGVMIGFGIGLLRILYANKDYVGDVIPLDYVANSTLAVAWATHDDWTKNSEGNTDNEIEPVKIYNCVSSCDNPQTWHQIDKSLYDYREYPSLKMAWYTTTNYTYCFFMFKVYTILYHCIPAFFIDKYLAWRGDKIRLLKIYRLIQKNISVAFCFMENWKFSNTNMRSIYNRMTKDDHKIFPSDPKEVDWVDYLTKYVLGLRVYYGKDPLTTMPLARKRAFKLKLLHYLVLIFYYSFVAIFWYGIFKLFGITNYMSNMIKDLDINYNV